MPKANRAYNFNAGPSALPLEVLERAREELVDFRGNGMSILEMSHRSKVYEEVHNEAASLLRELLGVPDGYHILFLQGGASLQFSMVPMNFLSRGRAAGYVLTGNWAEKAWKEAQVLGETFVAASTKEENYRRIPSLEEIRFGPDAAYLHITSNNTIFGTQWKEFPDTGEVPLIADMSSDILSRPVDVNQFALIYAGAQKNLGPAGVTVVIVREDLVERGPKDIPTMLQYRTHAKNNSLYNTPPVFAIYMMGLVLRWAKEQGGVAELERRNREKAQLIYEVIDRYPDFYLGHAEPGSRSAMNITFRLPTPELEQQFLEEAKREGFVGLNGHRSVGGCRASLYNAVPLESCRALREYMLEFLRKRG